MSEIVMVDGGGEDLGETHNGDARAPSQSTQQAMPTPNAQLSKPSIKTQATEETKRNHTRDSLSKNAIQLMQRITFKDLTPTT